MARPGSFFTTPSNGIFVGVIIGCALIGLLMALGIPEVEHKDERVSLPSDSAAAEFLASWERMRSGTWAVDSTFVRTVTDGRTFSTSIREAQRPPSRIRVSSAGVEAIVDGKRYACGVQSEEGQQACRFGGSVDYAKTVEAELDDLTDLLGGENRSYDVEQTGDCFRLFARPGAATETWGAAANVCFDPATGAQTRSRYERDGATDVIEAVSIRPAVTDAELRLPAPPSD